MVYVSEGRFGNQNVDFETLLETTLPYYSNGIFYLFCLLVQHVCPIIINDY